MAELQPNATIRTMRRSVHWDNANSLIFLQEVLKQKDSLRAGDNGFRKEQWMAIVQVMKERCNMILDIQQVKNHYKVWKQKIRGLLMLRNTSGVGFENNHFIGSKDMWESLTRQNKEAKYWYSHPVVDIHEEVIRFFVNEDATGNQSISVLPGMSFIEPTPNITNLDDDYQPSLFTGSTPSTPSTPFTQPTQIEEPAPDVTTSRRNVGKRKINLFDRMGDFIEKVQRIDSKIDSMVEIPQRLDAVLQDLEGEVGKELCDEASMFLFEHPKSCAVFLGYKRERQITILRKMKKD